MDEADITNEDLLKILGKTTEREISLKIATDAVRDGDMTDDLYDRVAGKLAEYRATRVLLEREITKRMTGKPHPNE